ncbi:MAG: hypothetical protein QXD66_05310 [Candidatus Nezhaarchaeales archaeon]|nr:MAG: hypothetical protein DSO06_05210 [Candidatus Nezhaarchaeota archaeon WYZ-LMO8]TDA36006.1 MAG: hypothetical protein DSO05_04345 [Candidatus Nezhaarchaeota archaeon WYZ-LMO7]
MPRVSNVLYSHCGIICSFCKAFVQGDCRGCDAHIDACDYIKCCLKRRLKCCFDCIEFPCKLHEEGFTWETEEYGPLKWKVYSDVFLRIFRADKKTT